MENTQKTSKKAILLAGIIKENPVFVSLLGMCSCLATTKTIESALGMGIMFILVLIGSNVLISLLRKIIPAEAKIPCYIVIIATFVTIVKMFCEAFLPALNEGLGVFIALIVVNCIILGRAEAFASKNGVAASFFDAIGSGIGYTMALLIMAVFREILGTGMITIGEYFPIGVKVQLVLFPERFAISLFTLPAGGFLTLGCILAFLAWKKNRAEAKAKALEKARIEALKLKKETEKQAAELQAQAKAKAEKEAQEKTIIDKWPIGEGPKEVKPIENKEKESE